MHLADAAQKLTRYIRTGELDPSLQIDPKRARIYLEIVHDNVKDTLKRAYPIAHSLLSPAQWEEITSHFIAEEDFSSPLLWKMPGSFLSYAQNGAWDERLNIPFLIDLLDFEWMEIELFMMPDAPLEEFSKEGRTLDDLLYLNPESRIAIYSFPVYQKLSADQPPAKGVYPLLSFRHPETGRVHFIALSPFFLRVIELVAIEPIPARKTISKAAKEFSIPKNKALEASEIFLSDLIDQQAIYGFLHN